MYVCWIPPWRWLKKAKTWGVLPHVDILLYLIIVQLEYLWWRAIYIQPHYLFSRWACAWALGIQFPHLPFQYVVIIPLWNILYVMWILWWCFVVCNNCRWIVLNMCHVIITVTCAYTSTLHVCLQLQYFLLQHPANRTHNPQLHTRPATWKPQHEIPQAATTTV